jgi:beta-fructofuranosidase
VLRLDDAWLWDMWFAEDGGRHHVFFLKAPRSLGDPNLRHTNACIGHAVSDDLEHWTTLPDALAPSPSPAFDDRTTWTGSIVRGDVGRWRMFYTGTSTADSGRTQRVGLATSDDLTTWRRHGTPIVEADPRWYEQVTDGGWADLAWRDPFVMADPGGDGWHMLITARATDGAPDERGVIGHARSSDLLQWEVQPPLTAPGSGFGHLEVPQAVEVHGQPVLVFSCLGPELSQTRRARGEQGGIWAAAGASVLGPFDVAAARRLTDESLYSGRLVQDGDAGWSLVAFRNTQPSGGFAGELTDPLPVRAAADGRWSVLDR